MTSPQLDLEWREARCVEGPDRCMDDMCRGSDVGMCGALSDRLLGIHEVDDDPYYYDEDDDA